jgi:hypothetical protein
MSKMESAPSSSSVHARSVTLKRLAFEREGGVAHVASFRDVRSSLALVFSQDWKSASWQVQSRGLSRKK